MSSLYPFVLLLVTHWSCSAEKVPITELSENLFMPIVSSNNLLLEVAKKCFPPPSQHADAVYLKARAAIDAHEYRTKA